MPERQDIPYFSGLSGLQLPIPKYKYPPPYENSSRLTYYSSLFNSIEINSSFYKIPQRSTLAKWATLVSDNFKFTFKLWKGITHNPNLSFNAEDVLSFLTAINSVNEKKGCLLIQFPPKMGGDYITKLDQLLECIKEIDPHNEWRIAVEFRNKSWYQEDVYQLLDSYQVSTVIQDIPKSATPLLDHTSDFIYVRFHGPTGNYRDSYSEEFLSEYAGYIHDWIEEEKTVYVYFNNTMGDAINNLIALNSFVFK